MDDASDGQINAEIAILRLKLDTQLPNHLSFTAHGVASLTSPALPETTSIVSGRTRRFFDLQHVLVDEEDLRAALEFDRLQLTWHHRALRLVAGRQAITWGVNFFWPVLDLFAPFPPERIDREYKPGVDAARLTAPAGGFSELDWVAAVLGESLEDDGSVGGLSRIHMGPADVGLMGGWFHRDVVLGGFVTADLRGTGLRGEVAFTDSGDELDSEIGRGTFWRATAGLDRQLAPTLRFTAEVSWNGFGASDPDGYLRIAAADRVQRGEVTSLGQYYLAGSLTWQAHPLVSITGVALTNLGDGSVLLLPHLDWTPSDDLSLELGMVVGIGPGRRSDGTLGSEYGAAPDAVYAAIKVYF